LNLQRTATPQEIKDAYRDLAKKHHPDARRAGDEPSSDKFRDVVEAYSILSSRENRASYDLSIKKNPDSYTPQSDV
jgi:DnaJ-class molecular chaperone